VEDFHHPSIGAIMKNYEALLPTLAFVIPLCACAQQATPPPGAPTRAAQSAMVKLVDAKGASAGQAVLTAVPDGVEIVVNATGLTPGLHGFHIHANGKCEPGPDAATGQTVAFGAAGGHFDPEMTGHHGNPITNAKPNHAGDVPNLNADTAGNATIRFVNTKVTLVPGKTSVIGRALVVHANADDYVSDPAGNSGGRVLCGVIEPARVDAVIGQAPATGAVR
jgi:Cu-Zn family superoxide dismutase